MLTPEMGKELQDLGQEENEKGRTVSN